MQLVASRRAGYQELSKLSLRSARSCGDGRSAESAAARRTGAGNGCGERVGKGRRGDHAPVANAVATRRVRSRVGRAKVSRSRSFESLGGRHSGTSLERYAGSVRGTTEA